MLYFANPSSANIRGAMRQRTIGCIATPKSGRDRVRPGVIWCADNGCFASGYPGDDAWWQWLVQHRFRRNCAFAVAPDIVGDAEATFARSSPWLPRIRRLDIPAAFVIQDGQEDVPVVWGRFDVMFIGGSTEFKLGEVARELTAEAVARRKKVHMGRVNSRKRLRYARDIGCSTADGTYMAFGPDKNLVRMLRWIDEVNSEPSNIGQFSPLNGRSTSH